MHGNSDLKAAIVRLAILEHDFNMLLRKAIKIKQRVDILKRVVKALAEEKRDENKK
jgi:hypothetical protein